MRTVLSVVLIAVCAAAQSPNVGDLVITELMPNPATVNDNNGEYFEICNISTKVLNLQGCSFIDTNSLVGVTINGVILVHPGEFVVFIRDAAQAVTWNISGQVFGYTTITSLSCSGLLTCVGGSSMNLGNTGDGIIFRAPNGSNLDLADYTTSAPSGIAYERLDLRASWSTPGNVVSATTTLDPTNFGSPGSANSGDTTKGWLRSLNPPAGVLTTGAVPDIPVLIGSVLNLHLLSPAHPGALRVLAASAGTMPGTVIGSTTIGLNQDVIMDLSLMVGSPYFVDFGVGLLGASGADTAAINVPSAPSLIGANIYAGFIVIDSMGGIARDSTIATLTFTSSSSLSSLAAFGYDAAVASSLGIPGVTPTSNIAEFVKALVAAKATNPAVLDPSPTNPAGIEFPLHPTTSENLRSIPGFTKDLVASWLDPLTSGTGVNDPRFGANCDYTAYFGEGWDAVPGTPPQFSGSGSAGWIWINHEYISGNIPTLLSPPDSSALIFARWLKDRGIIQGDPAAPTWSMSDVDAYEIAAKRELGGSWFRATSTATGDWSVDRSAANVRYDASSATLTRITGYTPNAIDHDDAGDPLPAGVASGILGDCSGGQTPWGTIITAEENVQDYYGDLEACWTTQQRFTAGVGFDAGAPVNPVYSASAGSEFGRISDANHRHERDLYGFLVEMDPGVAPNDSYDSVNNAGDGVGHRKLGSFGRARWENAAIVTGTDWKLVSGQPITIYGGDDRRSGRLFKWTSATNYVTGMTKAQIRALLDDGYLYVAHFQDLNHATGDTLVNNSVPTETQRGSGTWICLSTSNTTQIAPNAVGLGDPTRTVGAAITDVNWNSIGGFPNDNIMKACLFTVCNKIGIAELNRPEDVEWNPFGTPRLYIAFTNHGRKVANDQNGVLYPPAMHSTLSPTRPDSVGSIFVLEESNTGDPAASMTFTYFRAWKGSSATQNNVVVDPYRAANVDNLMIDNVGGVWFGTDGNFGTNGRADAVYYLDLDPAHQAGMPGVVEPTYGLAFRVAAVASDAEATGPCFTSDLKTLFINVQHPGEGVLSSWPASGL